MALRDLMNNYYYGKQGKADMTIADLPQNRRQLFGEVLKVRWSSMIGVNLLYMVIWIPAIIWTVMNLPLVYHMLTAEPGTYTLSDLNGLVGSYLLRLAPCIAITGPFNAGVTYVLRNWARDQHSFILSDFKDAVKANWKQAFVVSIVSGILPFVVFYGATFYSNMMSVSPLFVAPLALMLLIGLLWTLASMLMYVMLITYDLKLRDVIRNSVLLTVGKLPFALLIKLATLAVPAILLFIMWFFPGAGSYALLIVSVLYLVFIPIFNKLITVSYANWLCEIYLNAKIEGAPTNIGLRPENWDDTVYRPEDDE